MCAISPWFDSGMVCPEGKPPAWGTRKRPLVLEPKRMIPSRLHDPPSKLPAPSHRVWGGPPEASTFLTLPCETKPMERLSGDQKGINAAPSVPGNGTAASESSGRTHSIERPPV